VVTEADELYLARIEDGLGRSLDFTYQDVDGHIALVQVTDGLFSVMLGSVNGCKRQPITKEEITCGGIICT
jgi:hypothetical protein